MPKSEPETPKRLGRAFKGLCIRHGHGNIPPEAVAVIEDLDTTVKRVWFADQEELALQASFRGADAPVFQKALEELQDAVAKNKNLGKPLKRTDDFHGTHQASVLSKIADVFKPQRVRERAALMKPKQRRFPL